MHPLAVERDFLARAERLKSWGAGLLCVAAVFWIYAAWQMFAPFTSSTWKVDCSAPAFAERRDLYIDDRISDDHDRALHCEADRDWTGPVTALVLSVPVSTAGAVLLATGVAISALRRHDEAVRRAKA
ncbi:hypothetical protein [Streptomyces beijiangensis]|uniref:Uncharacterized protein n=1 Tax=Streptomyces beijiangensis TaxID=163361 RepID=A0A939JIS1_9ACTN|nr:hypothetical protein [Streptomyces beijiangensis]MBO0512869.1 hypothetical protein [Streptomyces beijiangensis]